MINVKFIVLFIQIYILKTLLIKVSAYECLTDSNKLECKLATRTPYRFIANYNDSQLHYPGCKEKKIWLMIRHGTRFPGKKHIKSMINDLPKLQRKILDNYKAHNSTLSESTIKTFDKWKLYIDASHTMVLTEEGENELTDLAERIQARFPTLLVENYSSELYKFKYTATQRTEASAKSFILGLFGQSQSINISFPEPEHKDPILRFYKRCQRWRTQVDKNPETYLEKELFIQEEIFQETLKEISKKVGFDVNYESARLAFIMCAFETAWNLGIQLPCCNNDESASLACIMCEFEVLWSEQTKSPWCDLFSLKDAEVLEFAEDLEYYWVDGYGYKLNYEQACPALKDMFTFFEDTDKSLATAYFTHSGSILKMLSILGIAKDEVPLTHNSYSIHKNSRKWKVSQIDAFSSNIAFVLYECENQGPSILMLHQERPVTIPGCPSELCPMTTMKNILPDNEEECQFEVMCSIDSK